MITRPHHSPAASTRPSCSEPTNKAIRFPGPGAVKLDFKFPGPPMKKRTEQSRSESSFTAPILLLSAAAAGRVCACVRVCVCVCARARGCVGACACVCQSGAMCVFVIASCPLEEQRQGVRVTESVRVTARGAATPRFSLSAFPSSSRHAHRAAAANRLASADPHSPIAPASCSAPDARLTGPGLARWTGAALLLLDVSVAAGSRGEQPQTYRTSISKAPTHDKENGLSVPQTSQGLSLHGCASPTRRRRAAQDADAAQPNTPTPRSCAWPCRVLPGHGGHGNSFTTQEQDGPCPPRAPVRV